MKRFLFSSFVLLVLSGLSSCQKDIITEPEIVVCYFQPTAPIRVLTSTGTDLLSSAKLASGKVDVQMNVNGGANTVYKTDPAIFSQNGQPDQFYFSVPLPSGDSKMLTVVFSLKDNRSDTLIIKTASSSSQLYGVSSVTFKGNIVLPKMLFNNSVYGFELVMDDAEK